MNKNAQKACDKQAFLCGHFATIKTSAVVQGAEIDSRIRKSEGKG